MVSSCHRHGKKGKKIFTINDSCEVMFVSKSKMLDKRNYRGLSLKQRFW